MVQYKAEPLNTFIDYDAFFQRALMLHEDVLEPFLAKLKHHIQSIHVCMGGIESWLLEPKRNIEFLEEMDLFFLVLDGSKFCVSRTKIGEEKMSKWRGWREVGVKIGDGGR